MSDGVDVLPLGEHALPWFARSRLRRVKRRHRTGLLLSAIIRTGSRAVTFKAPVVSVYEGDLSLCMCSPHSKFPKFAALEPGVHLLRFQTARGVSGSSFEQSVTLRSGDVLVAVCEPIQPWVFYAKSPPVNRWYISVDQGRPTIESAQEPSR